MPEAMMLRFPFGNYGAIETDIKEALSVRTKIFSDTNPHKFNVVAFAHGNQSLLFGDVDSW